MKSTTNFPIKLFDRQDDMCKREGQAQSCIFLSKFLMTTAASLPTNSWRVHFPMPSGVRRLQLKYCGSCFSHKNAARLKESSPLERDARISPPPHAHTHKPTLSSPFIARYAPHLSGQLSLTHHWSGQLATLIGNRAFFFKVAQSVNETSAPLWSNVCREAAVQRPKGTAESDSRQPLLFHSSCFLCPKAACFVWYRMERHNLRSWSILSTQK